MKSKGDPTAVLELDVEILLEDLLALRAQAGVRQPVLLTSNAVSSAVAAVCQERGILIAVFPPVR
jgi:hypothetical protein